MVCRETLLTMGSTRVTASHWKVRVHLTAAYTVGLWTCLDNNIVITLMGIFLNKLINPLYLTIVYKPLIVYAFMHTYIYVVIFNVFFVNMFYVLGRDSVLCI